MAVEYLWGSDGGGGGGLRGIAYIDRKPSINTLGCVYLFVLMWVRPWVGPVDTEQTDSE